MLPLMPGRHGLPLLVIAIALAAGCDAEGPINRPPEAVLQVANPIDVGQVARLDGSGSVDPDQDIALYRFVVADGAACYEVTTPTVEHAFRISGRFEVLLEVVDSHGASDTARALVSVREP